MSSIGDSSLISSQFPVGTTQVSELTAKIILGTATVDEINQLSPADREKVMQELGALYVASSPMLQLYIALSSLGKLTGDESAAIEALGAKMSLQYQDIVSAMLDSWAKNVQEINEQKREELRSTAQIAIDYRNSIIGKIAAENDANINTENVVRNASEFNSFVRSLPPEMREDLIYSQAQLAVDDYLHTNGLGAGSMDSYDALREGLTTVMVGAVVAGYATDFAVGVMNNPSTTQVAVNPSVDAIGSSNMLNNLPSITQDPALLTINLFVTQAALSSVALSFQITSNSGGEQIHDRTTAEQFAGRIINTINSDGFAAQLNNVLADKVPNYNQLSTEDKSNLFYMVKVGMLVTALAVLYQTETGAKMIAQDLRAMLKGEMDIPEGSKESEVLQALRGIIGSPDVPSETRVSLIETILAYLDSQPDVSSLFDPQEAIGGLLGQFTAGYHVEQQG